MSGVGSFTVDLAVSRATSPDGPFESFRLGVLPLDTDGVTLRAADRNLDTDVPANGNDRVLVGSSIIRFGRLALRNANGSQLVPLQVRMEAQHWNGTAFITNIDDNCTRLDGVNIEMSNYQGTGFAPAPNCKTRLPTTPVTFDAIVFAKGRAVATLTAPTGGATGNAVHRD